MKISDGSTLFEIIFAVNAVFPIFFTKYKDNRSKVIAHVKEQFACNNKDISTYSDKQFKKTAYAIYPYFKMLNDSCLKVGVFSSLSGMGLSISLLFLSAIFPESELHDLLFSLFVIYYLLFSPTFYYFFFSFTDRLTHLICSNKYSNLDIGETILALDISKTLDEIKKESYELQKEEFFDNMTKLKEQFVLFFKVSINPLYRYEQYQVNKIIKETLDKKNITS